MTDRPQPHQSFLDFVPPHSIEAEQSTLGSCLIESIAFDNAQAILVKSDFYREQHQIIWLAITILKDAGRPIDYITVAQYLKDEGTLDAIGGMTYITSLFDVVPTAVNILFYAQIVKDKALLRAMITQSLDCIALARAETEDVSTLLCNTQEKFFALGLESGTSQSPILEYRAVLETAYDLAGTHADIRAEGGQSALLGMSTGLAVLDAETKGLHRKTLTIIAARPSMGKSALAVQIAEHIALSGTPGHFFSGEMTEAQIGARMLSAGAMVESSKLMAGECDDDDFSSMASYIGRDTTRSRPLTFEFCNEMTIGSIRSKSRQLVRRLGLGLIVVDYLQLVRGSAGRVGNRQEEVTEIVKGLKAMAKELDVAVIAVAAIGRGPETREDKRPLLSDLRESGQIEFETDLALLLYRDSYYVKKTPTRGIAPAQDPDLSHEGFPVEPCEIIIAKHRSGSTGMARTGWQPKLVRFVTLDSHTEHYLNQSRGHSSSDFDAPEAPAPGGNYYG